MQRFRHILAAMFFLSLSVAAGHAAGPTPGGTVPPAWSAYAAQVALRLQTDLGDDLDATAVRLHAFLDVQAERGGQADKGPEAAVSSVVVRLWFGPGGRVTRVAFASLGDRQADKDLRTVLMGHAIGTAPPRGMPEPLVLRLRLATPA